MNYFSIFSLISIFLNQTLEIPGPNDISNKIFQKYKNQSYVIFGSKSAGTGFPIKAKSGNSYILTNYHVCVSTANKDGYVFVNNEYKLQFAMPAKILKLDPLKDLCLLTSVFNFIPINFGHEINDKDEIIIIGHPKTRIVEFSVGKNVGLGLNGKELVIHSNNKVDFGSSGSPVYNEYEELIGIVYAKSSLDNSTYYIPISEIYNFIEGY
jgi:S1-C subfamily serine protease